MSNIKDRISKLSEDRQALLNTLLSESKSNTNRILQSKRPENICMSHEQQSLWCINELDPSNPAYTCPVPLRLQGPLNKQALIDSLCEMIKRHEVLRTTYDMLDGEPVQVIHDNMPLQLREHDFSNISISEQDKAVKQVIVEDATTPFNLRQGPIMRVELICLNKEDHVLVVDVHHIANDHWSFGILFGELAAIYNTRLGVQKKSLEALPIQYADYSLWQHERLEGSIGEKLFNFWKNKLQDIHVVDLPTDHARPATMSFRGGQKNFELKSELVASLQEIAKKEQASLFMVLLSAFKVLLARYTAQTDISLGCSITERNRAELQGLIGNFVNTIVLRTELNDELSFEELLQRVRKNTLEAYANSEYPFDLLVQALNPHRTTDRNPLVSVMFMLDDTPKEVAEFHNLKTIWMEPSFVTSKFDILLSARPSEDGIHGNIQYSTDLFESETIEQLIRHYINILEAVSNNPTSCISTLPLMDEQERETMLVKWNDTERDILIDGTTIHETFAYREKKQSDATAIIYGDKTYSYADLNANAERLASYLHTVCTKSEELIAVSLERTPEYVMTILAVLQAGGAYVPLDPAHYTEGTIIKTMQLVDSHILICRRKDRLDEIRNQSIQIIYIDDFIKDDMTLLRCDDSIDCLNNFTSRQTQETPCVDSKETELISSDSLAYVICSSGTTGKPKAIAIRHSSALNTLLDLNQRFTVDSNDRVFFISSPSFDLSVYETMGTLIAGGAIVIPEAASVKEPRQWLDLVIKNDVTIWQTVPPLLELLVDELEKAEDIFLPKLRLVMLGGDWIPVSLPDRLRVYAPNVRIISLGGTTEASIHSTIYEVEKVDENWASIPYGVPLTNQRAYVLDRNMQPTPIGVTGELHFGGIGLAREYIGLPELTANRFVECTLRNGQPERIYKTGDLARWHRDGNLELIGRKDFQAKVHGMRVDLSDIEAVLCSCDGIKEAVVVVSGNDDRSASLTAFFIPEIDKEVDVTELRKKLTKMIPIYAIPSTFRKMESFPKNRNGKVDRRALEKITPHTSKRVRQEPTDSLEAHILDLCKEILGIDDIGIDDDFFEVGGDSFTAIRLARKIEGGLPVAELFKHRTVRMIANYLKNANTDEVMMVNLLTPESDQTTISLICIPYGGGNVSVYQSLADVLPSHIALWSVALPGHDPGRADEPFASWKDVAERCCQEIMEKIEGPIAIYGQCAGTSIGVYLTKLLEEQGREIKVVYVGAALPDMDPASSIVRCNESSDEELQSYLKMLGGFNGPLDDSEVEKIVAVAKHDMLQNAIFYDYCYSESFTKLRTPLHCILGDSDILTNTQEERVADWKKFAVNVNCSKISGGNHYFVKHEAVQLANLLAAELSL